MSTTTTETVTELVPGRQYRITRDTGGHGFAAGTVVRALSQYPYGGGNVLCTTRTDLPVGQGEDGYWDPGVTAWVRPFDVEPVEDAAPTTTDTPTEGTLRARAERAERELADFRDRVRDAVIAEAEVQGWCSRTDEWLTELGLKPRGPKMPTKEHALVLLTGRRVALLADDDDRPWFVFSTAEEGETSTGPLRWASVAQVAADYVATLDDGIDLDD